ncbi:[Fe-Fe] hydrogenase large subunit C-terminal domain-containing protein [Proteiniborus sp. DW1]|uniref:[Fe-Fe] hydrogenase large subunit C-terminal domain-containing protein n=1 Tax=Proteiniborus sp. DW1 TaxID=1889883 RepID=UPI000943AE85|nr:[Fe-Fe] hydrogenase large subunit C-terminal domain-containing protein [Proteiniborus sp. DW1]
MKEYFHSVVLDDNKCNGCTNCMRRCPTEAIRIREKKAVIIKDRCIDCGECIRVCPYHAKDVIVDDLSVLNRYKYNVAISPMSLYGQFSIDTDMNMVFSGIKALGFDHVFDEGYAADVLTIAIRNILKSNNIQKPVISSLCPAILRIIQVRFPSLIDNIITVESPMEVAARIVKIEAMKKYRLKFDEIGVFYLTQCPAKVTSIKRPIGIQDSYVNGALSIKSIYGGIVKNAKKTQVSEYFKKASPKGVGWGRVGGQSYAIGVDNYLAVDGIENVIKVLEEIELGKLNNIDYFEGLACVGGCVGGPLNVENPFIAKARVRNIARLPEENNTENDEYIEEILTQGLINWTEKITPKGVMILDSDINEAIKKIELLNQICKELPGIDCSSCGAPSCSALAEDIVRGKAKMEDCIFILKEKIRNQ